MKQTHKGEASAQCTACRIYGMQPVSHQFCLFVFCALSLRRITKEWETDKQQRRKTHANKIEIKPKYRS